MAMISMSELRRTLALLLMLCQLVALVACERYEQIPVPEQKMEFVGRWSAGSNFFELEADGDISLEIDGARATVFLRKGSVRRFGGELICVGVGRWKRGNCLSISTAPYTSLGREVIAVEGVELARE